MWKRGGLWSLGPKFVISTLRNGVNKNALNTALDVPNILRPLLLLITFCCDDFYRCEMGRCVERGGLVEGPKNDKKKVIVEKKNMGF